MESRIQFRIENETKALAQKAAQARGITLSEACRQLAEQLAEEQRAAEQHEHWLRQKVDAAFARLQQGTADYVTADQAEQRMDDFKAKIREKFAQK